MSGLLYIVNFIHEGGILYKVKQFFLLALIVLIFFFKLTPLLWIATMHSTVTNLSRILFIYNF